MMRTDVPKVLHELACLGYRFIVVGNDIKITYEGLGEPDSQKVQPLLEVVQAQRDEVREFLRIYCPKCGGVVFGTFSDGKEKCMACYFKACRERFFKKSKKRNDY